MIMQNNFIYKQLKKTFNSSSGKKEIIKSCIVAMREESLAKLHDFFKANNQEIAFRQNFIEYLRMNKFFDNKEVFILKTEYNTNRNTFRMKGVGDKELLNDFCKSNESIRQLREQTREDNRKECFRITAKPDTMQQIIKCTKRFYEIQDDVRNNPITEFMCDNEHVAWFQNDNGTWTCDLSYYDENYVKELKDIIQLFENKGTDVSLEEIKLEGDKLVKKFFGNKDLLPNDLTSLNEDEICDELEEFLKGYMEDYIKQKTTLEISLRQQEGEILRLKNKEEDHLGMSMDM